jgi:signal transduction histidine kinase
VSEQTTDSREPTKRGEGRKPLSSHVFARLVSVSTLSVVVLAAMLGWLQRRDTQRELRERRAGRAGIVARAVDDYLLSHERAVTAVAELAPDDIAGEQRFIDTLRATHPDILTALVADRSGAIVVASLPPGQATRSIVGLSVADREYFHAAMTTGKPFVSKALLGRGFGSDPIVAIAAPIPGGEAGPRGIVEASLNLKRLESFKSLVRGLQSTVVVITDPDGTVVFSQLADFPALSKMSAHPQLAEVASAPAEMEYVDSTKNSWAVATAHTRRGWHIYILQDAGVARRRVAGQLLVTALLVGLLAFVSLVASTRVARRVTMPLEQLAGAVRSMRGGEAPANVPLPHPKAPVEVAELFDDVREMAERVHASRRNLELTNRQLGEMLDLARAGSRTKTAFLAKMSHELRTPLNAVIGFNAILEQRLAGDAKGVELAQRARSAGSGMLHMIEELLEIARVESGQTELNVSDASLAAIATEGVRASGEAHPGAVDRIALVAIDDCGVRVDAEHLAKAIASVASAASELTAATVRVEARVEAGPGLSWIVVQCTIREQVDRETLTALLDPFWQGESGSGAVKFGATRLGLALAHRYAEIMGGELGIRTAPGETVFTIRVPDGDKERGIQPS